MRHAQKCPKAAKPHQKLRLTALSSRKGDWIQLFLVAFFFLLLLITILLLFAQKERMTFEREQFADDAAYEMTRSSLLSLLRQPILYDLNNDTKKEEVTLADAIVVGMTQEQLTAELAVRIPDELPYRMRVTYPDREIVVDHVRSANLFIKIAHMMRGRAGNVIEESAPRASVMLPSSIEVELLYVDRAMLSSFFSTLSKSEQDEIITSITQETKEEAGQ